MNRLEEKESSFTESLNRVLAIQNYGTCGSKFLMSLLDGHPNILSMPSLYMMDFYSFWPENVDRHFDSTVKEFVKRKYYWFDPEGYAPWGTDKMGPGRDESVYVDRDLFINNLCAAAGGRDVVSRRLFFQSLYSAYAASIGRSLDLDPTQYILLYPFSTMRPEWTAGILGDFPDIRFIHCFREPIQNFGSSFKLLVTRWGGFVNINNVTTALVVIYLLLLDSYIPDPPPIKMSGFSPILDDRSRSRVLRLEDLHQRSAETLNKLCDWLEIPWDDGLVESTYDGKMWWNRPESAQVTGFSPKPISRNHDDIISKVDRYRLEVLLSQLKARMGYATVSLRETPVNRMLFSALLLLPLKTELLSILPSRFSLPRTFRLLSNLRENVRTMIRRRSLRIGVGNVPEELYLFFVNWILLIPLRSYVKGRVGLFRAWKQLSDEELEVVSVL